MALPAISGATVYASDLYQLCQPAGGQEKGKYQINIAAYTTNAVVGQYMGSISRNATPVSVSIDTIDYPPSGLNNPTTDTLSANGFHVKATSTGAGLSPNVGGGYTLQY